LKSCLLLIAKNHLGYKCLHIPSGKVYIARHVVFNEINFPFKNSTPIISSSTPPKSTIVSIPLVPPSPIPASHHHNEAPQNPSLELSPNTSNSPKIDNIQALIPLNSPIDSEPPHPPRVHAMTIRSQNNIFKPSILTDGRIKYSTPKALTASLALHEVEPTCFTQASKHAEWRTTMNEEFDALLKNGTWSLVSPSPNMNIVGCKWVFRIKRKANGTIERYKAHLVAKGFH
jgi:hypothetical protein